jgi:hypothetical protein
MDTTAPRHYPDERSLVGLFSDLWRETSTLVHEEAELAKAEIAEKLSDAGSGIAWIAAGGAVLFAGLIVLLFAAVNALQLVIETEHSVWLAPLIVGAVVMVVGYVVLAKGRRALTASSLKPSRTMESLRQDADLIKEHAT